MSPSDLDAAVTGHLVRFWGKSRAAAGVRKRIANFLARHGTERSPPPILLCGEVGVGKSLLARLIHQAGPCPDGPFSIFDCAEMPPALHESELFGTAPGGFTPPKPGLFQRAHGGTLFIDGVGCLAPELLYPRLRVSRILRALEEQSVHRVGSSLGDPAEPAAVWIIAATSEDLKAAVHEGRFPNDLYQKLGQLDLLIPPLRKRPHDIPLLAEHYLALVCYKTHLPPKSFAADARRALLAYPWPGNVREVRAVIERAALRFAKNDVITAAMLALPKSQGAHAPKAVMEQ